MDFGNNASLRKRHEQIEFVAGTRVAPHIQVHASKRADLFRQPFRFSLEAGPVEADEDAV